jgi:hypothetical protein
MSSKKRNTPAKATPVEYYPGNLNADYILVRNAETVPESARETACGLILPGQSQEGYGKTITTDIMLQECDTGKKRRVYATCFSNSASHWVRKDGKVFYLQSVFSSDLRSKFNAN